MIRILAILFLVASGLSRLGIGYANVEDQCGESCCDVSVVEVNCCGDTFCPMSGGPCQCGVSPTQTPERLPDAPLPRTDRDSVTGLPNGPPEITPVIEPEIATPSVASLVIGLRVGKTHNEVQALLGVWQT